MQNGKHTVLRCFDLMLREKYSRFILQIPHRNFERVATVWAKLRQFAHR